MGGNLARIGVARLNADGSNDTTYNVQSGGAFASELTQNTDVKVIALGLFFLDGRSLAIQADGKIIIAGDFRISSTPNRNYIARLNTNGTLDTTFDTGSGTLPPGGSGQRSVDTVALQTDGKVLIGGRFEFYKDQPTSQILRLDSDGNRDLGFNSAGPGLNGEVHVLLRQPDQKLLMGYNGIASSKSMLLNAQKTAGIGRLNPDGSVDTRTRIKIHW